MNSVLVGAIGAVLSLASILFFQDNSAPQFGGGTGTLNQLDQWKASAGNIQLASTTASLKIPSLTNCDTIDTNGTGVFTCGTDDGGGAASFSTTSTDYWKSVRNFFSTTSADYWYTQQSVPAGFSTTSADYWKDVRNFFSTTSASYFSSFGLAWSTTSADYWETQQAARGGSGSSFGQAWEIVAGFLAPTTTQDVKAPRNLTVVATSSLATTTTAMLNGTIIVDGVHYPQTGAGIQAAITDQAARGGGTVHLPAAVYTVTSTITIPKDPYIKLQGTKLPKPATGVSALNGGTIIRASGTLTSLFSMSGNSATANADLSHDFQVENVLVDGNDTTDNCFYLKNVDIFKLENFRVIGCKYGIKTDYEGVFPPSAATKPGGIFVRNGTMGVTSNIGGTYIDLNDQTQVWISDAWFSGTASSTIRVASSTKVHMSNLEFNTSDVGIALLDSADTSTNDITVNNSVFAMGSGNAICTDTRTNSLSNRVTFSGNTYPSGTPCTLLSNDGQAVIQPFTTLDNGHFAIMPDGTGKVGIGTNTPTSTLHVYDGTLASLMIESSDNPNIVLARAVGVTSRVIKNTAGALLIQRSTTQGSNISATDMIIGATGLVGIGTSTPGTLLSLNGIANFHTATSTFYGTGGINIAAGCFAVGSVCISGSSVADGTFSTTSADYYVHSSTTIPKTYTANAFTPSQTFGTKAIFDRTGSSAFDSTSEGITSLSTGNLDILSRGSLNNYIDTNNNSSDAWKLFANTSSNEVFRIQDTGLVGIGTATPATTLSVQGNALVSGTTTATGFHATSSIRIASLTSCTEALETDASGNIVCGTDATAAGAANDFTFATTFNALHAATSSNLWLQGLLNASSTANISGTTTIKESLAIGTTTPATNALFSVGTSSPLIHINTVSGKTGFGAENTGPTRFTFGGGSNENLNPNIMFLCQDPTDARCGVSVDNNFIGFKSTNNLLGLFGYDYTGGVALDINMQEFGGNIGIASSTPAALLGVQGDALVSGTVTAGSLIATSSLTVSPLTSAAIITNASGVFAEYAGATCTNQFVRSLSVLIAATCAAVDLAADVTGALGIANGGLGAAFTDPNADQLMFWDDSAAKITGIASLVGAAISGTTLTINDVTCTDCLTSTEIADEYLLNNGDTGTGTYDLSGATVKQHTYASFAFSTTTTWGGTTTIDLGPAYTAESWSGVKCFTDAGTVNVSFSDGTNLMNMFNASTTVGTVTLSSNNTFTASEKRYVAIGTPASSPTKISCTVDRIVNN